MRRSWHGDRMLVVGLVIALVAAALAVRARRRPPEALPPSSVTRGEARFAFELAEGKIHVSDTRGGGEVVLEASVVVDGTLRPLIGHVRAEDEGTRFLRVIEVEAGPGLHVRVALEVLDDVLRARVLADPTLARHAIALRFETSAPYRVWVPGTGELALTDTPTARAGILETGQHPVAIFAPRGSALWELTSNRRALEEKGGPSAEPDAGEDSGSSDDDDTDAGRIEPMLVAPPTRLSVTSLDAPVAALDAGAGRDASSADSGASQADSGTTSLATAGAHEVAELGVLVGASPVAMYGRLHGLLGERTAKVAGRVTGASSGVRVYGVDVDGRPRVRAELEASGRFSFDAPLTVERWYAAQGATLTSIPIRFPPGTGWELVLDLSPGGELSVRVIDADTRAPLASRVWVHGIDGTLDPSFGPDFKASGAGPLVDVLRGEFVTPLPKGRYRVEALHGLEWTIDASTVEVKSERREGITLALRRVVPTPFLVGCDLHVHARPSFDTLVAVEDRVTSLVAAGVEFAVPTEHNLVGDYVPSIEALELGRDFTTVSGVEVTTFGPRYGHFGVFPYPSDASVPPYRGVRAGQMFEAARRGDPTRLIQVNHPRLSKGIGYFNIVGFDPKTGVLPTRMRGDFDAVEVYNGYEVQNSAQVEAVLRDWLSLLEHGHRYAATGSSDSHNIQYNWAGFPRTYVRVGEERAGEPGHPAEPGAIVASIKAGRSLVTSGPILDLVAEGAHPGEEVHLRTASAKAHLRVHAAPWIDVSSAEIILDGQSLSRATITRRPTRTGAEDGSHAEAEARSLRHEASFEVPLAPGRHWIVAIARGTRKVDDVLPFMPYVPMGFTNPVWITRDAP